MHTIIWQFTVKAAQCAEFEQRYGAGGSWAVLFRQSPDYRGTELYRDTAQDGTYITLDHWVSAAAFEAFKAAHAAAYAALDKACEDLSESEARIGAISTS